MTRISVFTFQGLRSLLAFTASLALCPADAATTISNPFPNLSGATSLQSNQTIGFASLTGNQETATANLISSSAFQVTFAFNVEDLGFGIDVGLWAFALAFYHTEADLLNRVNGTFIGVPFGSMFYLDGSPLQFTSSPAGITFLSPTDYGLASGGLTNHVLTTLVSAPEATAFFGGLNVGQNYYASVFQANLGVDHGGMLNVVHTGGDKAFTSPGPGVVTDIPGYITALHITPAASVPEPRKALLFLSGIILAVCRRSRVFVAITTA